MQRLDFFSGLPTSLSCNVLRDWLSLESVITLASAFCSKFHHEVFRELLHSHEYYISETVVVVAAADTWDILRKIGGKLRSVEFTQKLSPSQIHSIATLCQNLTHVQIGSLTCCSSELWDLLYITLRLTCVSFSTTRIHYSGPPSTFLSYADIQSESFRLLEGHSHEPIRENHCIDVLQMSRNVVRLNLNCIGVSASTLLQLPQLCPHLSSLGLKDIGLTDIVLSKITKNCPQIVHLDISDNLDLRKTGICSAIENLQGLQSLSIYNIPRVCCSTLKHLYRHRATTLHTLYITCTENRLQYVVGKFLERCTKLRTLHVDAELSDNIELSNMFQPSTLSRLTTLVLNGYYFSEENIVDIGKYGVNLEVLSIFELGCSCQSFMSLYNGCPKLKKLYINVQEQEHYPENTNVREFVLFALALWKERRPSLEIVESEPQGLDYDVMNM